jgi:hypothetical protein
MRQPQQPLFHGPALHVAQHQQQQRQPFPALDRLGSFDTLPVQSLQPAALASASAVAAPLAQPAWSGGLAPLSPQAAHGSGGGALSLPAGSLQAAPVPTSTALGLALTAAAAAGSLGSGRSMGMAINDEEEEEGGAGVGAGSSRLGLQACPSVGSAEEEAAGLRGEGGFGLSVLQHPRRAAAAVTAAAASGLGVPPSPAALQRSESQSQHHPASPALLLCRLQSLGLSTPAPQAAAAQEACVPALQQQQGSVGVSGRIAFVPGATGAAAVAAFPVSAAGEVSSGFGQLPAPLPLLQMLPPAGAGGPAVDTTGAPALPPLQHPLLHLHAPSFAGPSAFAPSGSVTPSALHLFPLPAAPGFGSGRLAAASSLLSRRASAFSPTYAAAAPSASGGGAGGLHMSLSVSPPASHTPLPLTQQQQQPAPLHHPTPQQHQLASATAPAAALLAAGLTVTAAAAVTRLTSAAASLYIQQQQQQQQSAAAASRLHHQHMAAPQPLHSHAVSGGEVSVTA